MRIEIPSGISNLKKSSLTPLDPSKNLPGCVAIHSDRIWGRTGPWRPHSTQIFRFSSIWSNFLVCTTMEPATMEPGVKTENEKIDLLCDLRPNRLDRNDRTLILPLRGFHQKVPFYMYFKSKSDLFLKAAFSIWSHMRCVSTGFCLFINISPI